MAHAGEGDVFSLVTSASWQYLDNVFYLPDNNEPTVFGPNTPRGDHSNTISVGVTADKLIGRQRLTANVSTEHGALQRSRYSGLRRLQHRCRMAMAGGQRPVGKPALLEPALPGRFR
jgi:hypothetical protein